MAEKVYFEFQGVIEDKGITYFLIELDKYDFEGKESENPALRAEELIHLQNLVGIQQTKGPTRISREDAEKLHKVEPIGSHRDGKFWIVERR